MLTSSTRLVRVSFAMKYRYLVGRGGDIALISEEYGRCVVAKMQSFNVHAL